MSNKKIGKILKARGMKKTPEEKAKRKVLAEIAKPS